MIEFVKFLFQFLGWLLSCSDWVFEIVILLFVLIIVLIFVLSVYQFGKELWLVLQKFGLNFFMLCIWNLVNGEFGVVFMIVGMLIISFVVFVISVLFVIVSVFFVVEYVFKWFVNLVGYLIELFVVVLSVVYGFFVLFVIVLLFVKWQVIFFDNLYYFECFVFFIKCLQLWVENYFLFQCFFVFNGGVGCGFVFVIIILMVMILFYIVSVVCDVIWLVFVDQCEVMYVFGVIKWEVIFCVILFYVCVGIMGGVILVFGCVLGEMFVVVMVIGDSQDVICSLWGNVSIMVLVIVNQFGDVQEIIYCFSVVMFGLMLFFFSVFVNYLVCIIIIWLMLKGIQQ